MNEILNETVKTILERTSCKSFIPDKMPDNQTIDSIIKCGLYAPSAMNTQAWHLTVLAGEKIINEMNTAVFNELDEVAKERIANRNSGKKFSINYQSPVFIIVSCSNKTPFPFSDCACVLENMFLAATSLGIGSCWINQLTTPLSEKLSIRTFLDKAGVPKDNKVYGCCALGYPAAPLTSKPRIENTVNYIKGLIEEISI